MSKYGPLLAYFRDLSEEMGEITLLFEEIERVIQAELPHTARIDRPWWANTQSSTHARRWLDAGWKVQKVNLDGACVTFTRLNQISGTLRGARNRYERVHEFFEALPALQEQIALSFAEFGTLIGGKLPRTAFQDPAWWANTKSSPQGASWVTAGWRIEAVFIKAQIATFRRRRNNPLVEIRRYVKDLLDGSCHLGRPDARMMMQWIRFSKQLGWYFQATVLYDRGGLDESSLTENERAELDEDYRTCKRELSRYKSGLQSITEGKSHA